MANQKYIVTFEFKPAQNQIAYLNQVVTTASTNGNYKILDSIQEVEDFINDNEIRAVRVYEIASEYRIANQKVKLEKRA